MAVAKSKTITKSLKTKKARAAASKKKPVKKPAPKSARAGTKNKKNVAAGKKGDEGAKTRKRRALNPESIKLDSEKFLGVLEERIAHYRENKLYGVKDLKSLRSLFKQFSKDSIRMIEKKRKRSTNPDKASHTFFKRPFLISDLMVECLGLESTQRYCTAELTKAINQYAEKNELKDPDNGRLINLDDNLKKLFDSEEDQILFQHIQGFIQKHICRDDVKPPRNMDCRADFGVLEGEKKKERKKKTKKVKEEEEE